MKLLAIETATDACSCAVYRKGRIGERFSVEPRRHAELILAMADELLNEEGLGLGELDAIAFGRGPGSFTGVRIAAAVAQGLAFGAGLPVVPVSTLHALASAEASRHEYLLAVLDARMGQVYCGAFRAPAGARVGPLRDEWLGTPEEVVQRLPAGEWWWGVGNGFTAHAEALHAALGARLLGTSPGRWPHAAEVARLAAAAFREGAVVAPEDAQPAYLREQVATPHR